MRANYKIKVLPVQMEGCNLSVVSFEVGEVKMIWQRLLFSGKPVTKENTSFNFIDQ